MKKIFKTVAAFLAVTAGLGITCLAESSNYVVYDGKRTVIPDVYEYVTTITGVASDSGSSFSAPNDVFIDDENFIYIADSGNNRVLKLAEDGRLLMEISDFDGDALINPTGVYVDKSGRIFITDTGNYRLLIFDKNGKCLEKNGKPESDLLSGLSIYMPEHVVYSEKTK